jgi:uncharacterized protein (UPF0218 family)
MVEISQKTREELRKPLGMLYSEVSQMQERDFVKRIISVGDICTIKLLKYGITPHLAVFDFKFMRNDLDPKEKSILTRKYQDPIVYSNPAGSLSDDIIQDAPELLDKGGAIFIDGEEDLCALAFILSASEDDRVVYGQPDQGIVVVKPDERIKERIRRMLGF